MEILGEGKCWIRLNQEDYRIRRLRALLPVVENWVCLQDPRVRGSHYWGVCRDAPGENVVVNLSYEEGRQGGYEGEDLLVNYYDVMRAFPELRELFKELELQPYLGRNSIGNWGIHRHCYNPVSRWNLVLLGEGNDGGAGIFFRNHEEYPEEPSYEYVVDYLEEGCSVEEIERCALETGQAYSIDTWTWHSHQSHHEKAVAWLMHFKYADKKESVKEVLAKLESWGLARILWREGKRGRYRHGTHEV